MQPKSYTDEQKADINERTGKALAYLKELELAPQAQVSKGKITLEGNEFFVDVVQPYLLDTKYSVQSPVISPLSGEMTNGDEPAKTA